MAAAVAVAALASAPVSAQTPAWNHDESWVGDYRLPALLENEVDPTAESWRNDRRSEILELFAVNQFGRTPDRHVPMRVETIEADGEGLSGLARRMQLRIRPAQGDGPVIRVVIFTPKTAAGPYPVLLHVGFSPNVLVFDEPGIDEGEAWNVRTGQRIPDRQATLLAGFDARPFIRRGFAVAHVYYGDIEPDFDGGARYGVRALFEDSSGQRRPDEWGAIGAWAWGLSRVADALEGISGLDNRRLALSGASRLGKTTLWAAAQDPRFALVMPIVSGEGGAALSRRDFGETVAAITAPDRYDYWWAPRYQTYGDRVPDLPVDSHMLLALIAPRPMLLITGQTDDWSDPRGEYLAAQAAEPAYALFGKSGLGSAPLVSNRRIGSELALFQHSGGHGLFPEDLDAMVEFMEAHFSPPMTPVSGPSAVAAANAARAVNRNRPSGWWTETRARDAEWYGGPEARRMSETILSWQDPATGGWPLMNTTAEPNIGDPSAPGPWGTRAALIKATVNEMRFLARLNQSQPDRRFVQAIDRGLGFILDAQYPSGGWPHSWPVFANAYDHQATFNDDEMVDLMTLLREVAHAPDFAVLAAARRQAASDAFDLGVDFIIKSQIRIDGVLTAWCAQHDEVTYEPRGARAFEPVSISGGESASILLLLMSLDDPAPEVVNAIEAGAAWYRRSALHGLRVELRNGDRVVIEDAEAPDLWARFYDISTNQPIFAGRDGVIRSRLDEIEQERRAGYAWYGDWGRSVLARYEEWRARRAGR